MGEEILGSELEADKNGGTDAVSQIGFRAAVLG